MKTLPIFPPLPPGLSALQVQAALEAAGLPCKVTRDCSKGCKVKPLQGTCPEQARAFVLGFGAGFLS